MKTIGSVLKRLLLALGGSAAENYLNDITLVDRIAELAENGQISSSAIQGGGSGGGVMYFRSRTVNVATNAEIFRITSVAITTQTVPVECTFASPAYIISDVTWTSYDGYIAFYGTCTAATTADVTLSNVETPSPQIPLAIANGGTGANTAAGALANLGINDLIVVETVGMSFSNGLAVVAAKTGYYLVSAYTVNRGTGEPNTYAIANVYGRTDGTYQLQNKDTTLSASLFARLVWVKSN